MSVAVGNYEFQGPYWGVNDLKNKPGIYAVVNCVGDEVLLLEVSDGAYVRERLQTHPRLSSWQRYFPQTLGVLVHYTEGNCEKERRTILKDIQDEFGPFLNLTDDQVTFCS